MCSQIWVAETGRLHLSDDPVIPLQGPLPNKVPQTKWFKQQKLISAWF